MSSANTSATKAPAIVSPVSRHLFVRDVQRSTAFYRDVLGFAVEPVRETYGAPAEAEVVNGPARIQLGAAKGSLTPEILFFETDDVRGMHDTIAARGGNPTEPRRVNWIKIEMFEVRDPDGHTLWFGKSFHQEPTIDQHTPRGKGQLRQALPEFPLTNVPAARKASLVPGRQASSPQVFGPAGTRIPGLSRD